jgi:hypothetical protein
MFAHGVNPFLLITFWSLVLVSAIAGASACVISFLSRRRQRWFFVVGVMCVTLGCGIAYLAIHDGAIQGFGLEAVLEFAPLSFGVIGLIRWRFLKS